jgi:uncharacterized protein YbjT (DUF2867 family)
MDVMGTRRLLAAAKATGVKHFLYISIAGIDRIPFPYYRAKVAAEAEVEQGGVPYTILRATQFHSLIDGWLLQPLKKFPAAFIPTDFKFQPVDTGEVAEALCALAQGAPVGRAPDMGGPEVLTLGEMARPWLAAQRKRGWPLWLPVPGAVGHAFRNGYNTCPANRQGKITWAQWVAQKYNRG